MTEYHPWYEFALKEIDLSVKSKKKILSPWELEFLKNIRARVEKKIGLSEKQILYFQKLHQRCTEIPRIKR